MPLGTFPISLAIAIIVTLASLIYLLLNARGVARLFRRAGMDPGPGRPVSRTGVIVALIAFNLGWIACVFIYWTAWSGLANEAVETNRPPIEEGPNGRQPNR